MRGNNPKIEITPAMMEAGRKALYGFRIQEPDDDEMREAVAEVFKAMFGVREASEGHS